jgi:hypothetical protein
MKATILVCLWGCLLWGAMERVEARNPTRENPDDASKYTRETRLIFYAVLEGLYEDGVAGEALDLIVPDPQGMTIKDHPEQTNFVYACPLCMPAFDAFRLYAARSPFYGQKGTDYNTFGPGLSDEMVERLKGAPQERREVIQELMRKWVQTRLDGMALSDAERAGIEENLKEMKERGEETLKGFQEGRNGEFYAEEYADWKKCAICSGVVPAEE